MNTHQTRPVSSNHSTKTQEIMEECWARDLGYNDMLGFLGRSVHFWPSKNEYENLCQSMTNGMEESFQEHKPHCGPEFGTACICNYDPSTETADEPPEAHKTVTTLQLAFMTKLNALEYAAQKLIGITLARPPEDTEASEAIVAFEILKEINRHRTYLGDVHPCVLPEADFVDVPEDPYDFDRTGQEPEQ